MTHVLNSERTVAIAPNVKWIRIDEHTPRGVKVQLISEHYGVAQYGLYTPGNTFFTHWAPVPTFDKAAP